MKSLGAAEAAEASAFCLDRERNLAPLREAIPEAILVAHVLEAEAHEPFDREDRVEGMIGCELAP